jgi:hypothetical protein
MEKQRLFDFSSSLSLLKLSLMVSNNLETVSKTAIEPFSHFGIAAEINQWDHSIPLICDG